MAFLGFHHVQVAMPAGQEARADGFYGAVLGFERAQKPPRLAERGGCWFRSGSVELHLGVEDPFTPARKAHPALVVDDLEELRGRLQAAGVEVLEDTQLDGHDRFYAHDPFGNRLEFIAER